MKPLLFIAVTTFLFSMGTLAYGAQPENTKEPIITELTDLASELSRQSKDSQSIIEELQRRIKQRGYVESRLLKAQDHFIQAANFGEKSARPLNGSAFFAIHAYLVSTWRLKANSNWEFYKKYVFPVVLDDSYSWHLRSHYLRRAKALQRDHRGPKSKEYRTFKKALLALSYNLESDPKESPEMKSEALNVIATTELDDQKRRKAIARHCRSKNERLRKQAIHHASFPVNLDDELLEEILQQYEDRKTAPSSVKRELGFAVGRIVRFANKPKEYGYKKKALERLNQIRGRETDPQARKEIEALIADLTPKDDDDKEAPPQKKPK